MRGGAKQFFDKKIFNFIYGHLILSLSMRIRNVGVTVIYNFFSLSIKYFKLVLCG